MASTTTPAASGASGYVYDPAKDTWSAIAAMPVARDAPGAAAVLGQLYVTGGYSYVNDSGVAETDVYNPASGVWSTVSPNPEPTAGPGVGVADGKIYFVGGNFEPDVTPSSAVEVYDPATDTWSTAASYPHPVAFESCGGIDGKIYCAGGLNESFLSVTTYTDGYVYDPGTNTWSPIASLPIDLWGSAHGAAGGLLVVSGGITDDATAITNQGYAYNPTTNSWTAIPAAQYTTYLAGSACGFYKIGGDTSNGNGQVTSSEVLAGLNQCSATVPWLAARPATTVTLQPRQSITVRVTLSATTAGQVTQPGTYAAQLGFEQNTPYTVSPDEVTMKVTPPRSRRR